jgi:putative transposase
VKHYYRLGLEDSIPNEIQQTIPSSNISRWKNESNDKYIGCQVAEYINQELELIKRIGQNRKTKNILKSYFKLIDTLHHILKPIKSVKQSIYNNKETIVNTIENLKLYLPVAESLKIFNISRSTYQYYKTLVLNKCDSSYFQWCLKNYPQQLLKTEISIIKNYLIMKEYQFWSKSSIYFKAVRDKKISCGLSTWYKYCKLLGFGSRHLRSKKSYSSMVSDRPNQIWCADVTIFKTNDGTKHHIHFLMDHFSKKILGYKIQPNSSGITVKMLLQTAYRRLEHGPSVVFLTDGGSENVNNQVVDLVTESHIKITHLIAQKDIQFSNSSIEAFNKIIKHQFLLPLKVSNGKMLRMELDKAIFIYNNIRPQFGLKGNTPEEAYQGNSISFEQYKSHFKEHKKIRVLQNKGNKCKVCVSN